MVKSLIYQKKQYRIAYLSKKNYPFRLWKLGQSITIYTGSIYPGERILH